MLTSSIGFILFSVDEVGGGGPGLIGTEGEDEVTVRLSW